MKKTQYGLFTVIAMIVGTVIGSGIFFKSDNILVATNGNVVQGIVLFGIAAISIIFGSLTISELSSRYDEAGGVITYAEKSYNSKLGSAFGWFYTFLYYPTLNAVVAWVGGIYACMALGIDATLETQILVGLAIIVVLMLLNVISAKLGGIFQGLSTVIKLVLLIAIAIAGLTRGDVNAISSHAAVEGAKSLGWFAGLSPILFAFDGWIVATSVGHEVKNSKKNLKLALVIAPIIILAIYIAYFVGISMYVGPQEIMAVGDKHVNEAATKLLGSMGAKVVLVCVTISILGVVNGLTIALSRMPYSLALRKNMPGSKSISKMNEKAGVPVVSSIVAFIITLFWLAVHYITQKYNLLPNSDISEISITMNYALFIILYFKVFMMARKGEIKGVWKGIINPILATLGSIIVLASSMNKVIAWIYALVCLAVLVIGYAYAKSKGEK